MHRVIVIAIPVFALLIAAEFVYGLLKGRNTYRLNDTIASLSQGLLSQVVAVCTQLFQIGLYNLAFPHLALFAGASLWDVWPGWLLAIVLYDFCDYGLHRVSHESALFWAAHVVHHQSQCMNLSTALRQESTYALLGWVFYLPLAVLGVPPGLYAVAGLVVLVYQFWIHTEHIGRLGWFDRVFSSPSNHRVHHAVNDRYLDKNYGAILVVWDRLFGSFEPETERCVYGTRDPLNSWNPLWAVAHTYAHLLRKSARAASWTDRLRVLFKGPGWQVPGASRDADAQAFVPEAVVMFDPPMTAAQRVSAAVVFVAIVAAICGFLWRAETLSDGPSAAAALAAAAALWCVGAIMSGRIGWRAGSLLGALACMAVLAASTAGL